MTEARVLKKLTRLQLLIFGNQHSPGQYTKRAFQHAHVLVKHHRTNAGTFQECHHRGNQNRVIGANEFAHPKAVLYTTLPQQMDEESNALAALAQRSYARFLSMSELNLAVVLPFESPNSASLNRLSDLVARDMERVNSTILARTGSEVAMIPEVANHLISSGGKRLRPMLTLAMAKLGGYSGDGHIKLAAAVEFMHTATLLHDDVVDESDMRRGKIAARMLWGNEASVLVGDFLLGQAFKMMVEVGNLHALDILSSAAAVIAEGEVMQLGTAKNTATNEDEYLAVIRAKTAELFAAACEVGPALAAKEKAELAACRSFGMNLGIAFQLIDDALDYGGKSAKLGKNVGDDFREGKITLPVVLSFRRGIETERAFWNRTLGQGDIRDDDLDLAIALMAKYHSIEDTVGRARHYGAIAIDALALVPPSEIKSALEEAVAFCIGRVH